MRWGPGGCKGHKVRFPGLCSCQGIQAWAHVISTVSGTFPSLGAVCDGLSTPACLGHSAVLHVAQPLPVTQKASSVCHGYLSWHQWAGSTLGYSQSAAGRALGYRQSAAAGALGSEWGPSPLGPHRAHSVLRLPRAEGKAPGYCLLLLGRAFFGGFAANRGWL